MLAPPPITTMPDPHVTDPFELRKPLGKYVKEFATPQGYGINIAHSGQEGNLYCNYECHQSGKPAKKKIKHVEKKSDRRFNY